tara:strand:- start:191 stop:601 length:411 start_codon:yes stop_codon:yes gene_type:complete
MTPSTTAPRFGRAGGPTSQHVREFGDITVSSLTITNPTAANFTVLGEPSGLTGVAGSYYRIWGYMAGSSATAWFGFLETEDGDENISPFAVTSQGPMFQSFTMPIILDADLAVRCRSLNSMTGKGLVSLQFTVHAP